MWASLLAVYEKTDPASKINALKEYHRYTYDGSSMAVHLARIGNLTKHCVDVGEKISDENLMAKMLENLPERFSAMLVSWDVVADQKKDHLKRMLIQAETRMTSSAEHDYAMAITLQKKKVPKTDYGQRFDRKTIECDRCHKKGHIARNCWAKEDDDSQPSADVCFTVMATAFNPRNEWIADSGASSYMCNNKSWLSSFKAQLSTMNQAGESTLIVKGCGQVAVERMVNGRWEPATLLDVLFVPGLRKNLISVGAMSRQGISTEGRGGKMLFRREGRVILEAGLNAIYMQSACGRPLRKKRPM